MPAVPVPHQPSLADRMRGVAENLKHPTERGAQFYSDIQMAITLLETVADRVDADAAPLRSELNRLNQAASIMRQIIDGHEVATACCCGECYERDE